MGKSNFLISYINELKKTIDLTLSLINESLMNEITFLVMKNNR